MIEMNMTMVRGDDVTWTLTTVLTPTLAVERSLRNLAKLQRQSYEEYLQENLATLIAAGTLVVTDITGCTFTLTVRKGLRSPELFSLSSTDGEIVLSNPTVGEVEITVSAEDTEDFLNVNQDYFYDIVITKVDGTSKETLVKGKLRILGDVTYE